jgi:hypothetical protein
MSGPRLINEFGLESRRCAKSEGRAIPLASLSAFAHEGYGSAEAAVSPLHESVMYRDWD